MNLILKIQLVIHFLLDIVFPKKCLGCQKRGETLCNDCILKIKLTEKEINKNIIAVFDYKDPLIKKVIWNIKYHHLHSLGLKLGEILYESLIEDIADLREYSKGNPFVVIPVPISKDKVRARGYNQALVIASAFCDCGGRENFILKNTVVVKKTETIPQAKIKNRQDRLRNIRNSFEIRDSNSIRGRTVIIIDDVTTTGGTLNEMMRILKLSGAKKVVGFAVAH